MLDICYLIAISLFKSLNFSKNFMLHSASCLFVWFLCPLQQPGFIADGSHDWGLAMLRTATNETERGDHDFRFSQSHHTDIEPTIREQAATAEFEPRTSSPGVVCCTDWATAPPHGPAITLNLEDYVSIHLLNFLALRLHRLITLP